MHTPSYPNKKNYIKYIPGISVTVYLPPYLVGLKMSDWMDAMAVTRVSWVFMRSAGVTSLDTAYI